MERMLSWNEGDCHGQSPQESSTWAFSASTETLQLLPLPCGVGKQRVVLKDNVSCVISKVFSTRLVGV